jgi:hypothetical protein
MAGLKRRPGRYEPWGLSPLGLVLSWVEKHPLADGEAVFAELAAGRAPASKAVLRP